MSGEHELQPGRVRSNDDLQNFSRGFIVGVRTIEGNGGVVFTIEHPEDHRKYDVSFQGVAQVQAQEGESALLMTNTNVNGLDVRPALRIVCTLLDNNDNGLHVDPEAEWDIGGLTNGS